MAPTVDGGACRRDPETARVAPVFSPLASRSPPPPHARPVRACWRFPRRTGAHQPGRLPEGRRPRHDLGRRRLLDLSPLGRLDRAALCGRGSGDARPEGRAQGAGARGPPAAAGAERDRKGRLQVLYDQGDVHDQPRTLAECMRGRVRIGDVLGRGEGPPTSMTSKAALDRIERRRRRRPGPTTRPRRGPRPRAPAGSRPRAGPAGLLRPDGVDQRRSARSASSSARLTGDPRRAERLKRAQRIIIARAARRGTRGSSGSTSCCRALCAGPRGGGVRVGVVGTATLAAGRRGRRRRRHRHLAVGGDGRHARGGAARARRGRRVHRRRQHGGLDDRAGDGRGRVPARRRTRSAWPRPRPSPHR